MSHSHHGHSHGHGHSHSHDTSYLVSKNTSDPGVRITRIGLYVNVGMAVAKGAGGYVFNSQALTADALHALTDLVSDITTLATISYSLKRATARFPLGYGKVESLGGLAVCGLLLSGGFMIGFQALVALSQQFLPELGHFLSTHIGHGHSHSHTDLSGIGPDLNAAWLAAGSILVKEYLYRATMRIAESQRSTVLAGNAYHHRVDCLTSIVALITILASRFATHAEWLDPVGGLLISGMIVQAGWGATRQALLELADVSVDDHVKDDVAEKVRSVLAAGGVGSLRGVQGVKSGQSLLMEVEIGVRRDASLGDLGDLEGKVREEVGTVSGVKRVVIRFVSSDGDEKEPFEDEFVESNGLSNGNEHGKKE